MIKSQRAESVLRSTLVKNSRALAREPHPAVTAAPPAAATPTKLRRLIGLFMLSCHLYYMSIPSITRRPSIPGRYLPGTNCGAANPGRSRLLGGLLSPRLAAAALSRHWLRHYR